MSAEGRVERILSLLPQLVRIREVLYKSDTSVIRHREGRRWGHIPIEVPGVPSID